MEDLILIILFIVFIWGYFIFEKSRLPIKYFFYKVVEVKFSKEKQGDAVFHQGSYVTQINDREGFFRITVLEDNVKKSYSRHELGLSYKDVCSLSSDDRLEIKRRQDGKVLSCIISKNYYSHKKVNLFD